MRTRLILSVSILSFAVLTSGCSRHKSAAAAPTPKSAAADQAATEAAEREAAKIREAADAERLAAERAAGERELAKASLTTPVQFEFDRAEITEEGLRLLDQKVEALQKHPTIRIRIEGNADDYGSDEYNMVLSQRRAAIVHRYFAQRGIDASRLQIVSYGEEKPICTERDEPCRSKNRRDEFVILGGL